MAMPTPPPGFVLESASTSQPTPQAATQPTAQSLPPPPPGFEIEYPNTLPETPALDQLSAQYTQQRADLARTLAKGDISLRQKGEELLKLPTADDGSTIYLPITVKPQNLSPSEQAAIMQAHEQAQFPEMQQEQERALAGQRMTQQGLAAIEQQSAQEAMATIPRALRPLVGGLAQSGIGTAGFAMRPAEMAGVLPKGTTDRFVGNANAITAGQYGLGDTKAEALLTNAVASLADALSMGALTKGAGVSKIGSGLVGAEGQIGRALGQAGARVAAQPVAGFLAKGVNNAITDGRNAGLEGTDLAQYAAFQGGSEAIIMSAFAAAGLSGIEDITTHHVAKGFAGRLAQLGVSALEEIPEELLTTAVQQAGEKLAGTNPQALDWNQLGPALADTFISTIMTVGLAETIRGTGRGGPKAAPPTKQAVAPTVPELVRRFQVKAREGADKGKPMTFASDLEKARHIATSPGFRGKVVEEAKRFVTESEAHAKTQPAPAPSAFSEVEPAVAKQVESAPVPKGETTPEDIQGGDYTVLTAENPNAQQLSPEENQKRQAQLTAELDKLGVKYNEVKGYYGGNVENSVMVQGLSRDQAVALGKQFGQESVLRSKEGLVYGDGRVVPISGTPTVGKASKDGFSVANIKGQKVPFVVPLDFSKETKPTPAPAQPTQTQKVAGKRRSQLGATPATPEQVAAAEAAVVRPTAEQQAAKAAVPAETKTVADIDRRIDARRAELEREGVTDEADQLNDEEMDRLFSERIQAKKQTKFIPGEQRKPDVEAAVNTVTSKVRGFKRALPANTDQAQAAKAFRARGTEIVYYDGEGRGFRDPAHPNVLFINRKNVGEGLREAVAHEFGHDLADNHPELFNEFVAALPESEQARAREWYTEAFQKQRPGQVPADLQEEGQVVPFGRTGMNSEVWAAALGKNPSLLTKIAAAFRNFLAKLGIGATKNKQIQAAIKAFQATLEPAAPKEGEAQFLPGREKEKSDALMSKSQRGVDGALYYTNLTPTEVKELIEKSPYEQVRSLHNPKTGNTLWWSATDAVHTNAMNRGEQYPTRPEGIRGHIALEDGVYKWVGARPGDTQYAPYAAVEKALNIQDKTIPPSFLPEGKKRLKDKEVAINALSTEDRTIWDRLLPEEKTWVSAPGVKRVAEAYRTVKASMPSEQWQAAMRAGQSFSKWYQKATAAIREIFGADAPLFTALLAADSPRQKVSKNLNESLRVWQAWDKAGRPTDPARILEIARPLVQLSTRLPNIVRALTGDFLSGPKVNSFGGNLLGNLTFVTNDTWMAQFSGVDQNFFGDDANYLGYSALVREEAAKGNMEPAEAQAAVWSFFSVLANSVNSTTKGRDALERLTGEKVLNANEFDFIKDENVLSTLRESGVSEDTLKRAAAAAEAIVAIDNARGEITGADKQTLIPIADRAEQVAKHPVNPVKLAKKEAEMAGIEFSELQLPSLAELRKTEDEIAFLPNEEDRGVRPDLSLRTETKEGRAGYVAEDIKREAAGEPVQKGDIKTNAEADKMVARGDPAIHELIAKGRSGQTYTDVETVAVKKIVDAELPKAINSKSVSRMALIGELIAADRKAGTEAGRAFRQRRDPLTPAQHLRNTMAEAIALPPVEDGKEASKGKRVEHLKRIRKHLIDTGRINELTDANLRDPVWVGTLLNELSTLNPDANPVYEYFLASILSGFQTQERNAIGNVVNFTMNQIMLRPIEMTINAIAGDTNGAQFGEYKYLFRAMGPRIAAAWVNAVQSFRAERAVFQGRLVEGHADLAKGPAIRGTKGKIIRTPLRLLTAVDQFMKTVVGMGEVGARAYRKGLEQGLKRGSPEMEQFVNDESQNLDSESWKEAYAYAKYVAFQDDPGPMTRALTAVREVEIYGFKPLRYVVIGPFVRIAGKLESETWNYTPLGTARIAAKTLTGAYKNNQSQAVQDMAKQVVAWALTSALWALSGSDDDEPWITGTAAKEARNFAYQTAPPMSVRLPGYGWVAYKHLQPISGSVATIMDGIERVKAMGKGETAGEAAGKLMQQVKQRITDQTFLQSMGDFIDAMDSEDKASTFLANFGASWVPNLIRQPLYQADPNVREAKSLADTSFFKQLKRRALPGVDNALPRVTPWGNDVTRAGTALERMLSPFTRFDQEVHPGDKIIAKYNRMNPTDPFYPAVPQPRVKVGDENVKLTEEEYYLMLRLSGKLADRRVRQLGRVRNGDASRATIDAIAQLQNGSASQARDLMTSAVTYKMRGNDERYRAMLERMRNQIARLEQ